MGASPTTSPRGGDEPPRNEAARPKERRTEPLPRTAHRDRTESQITNEIRINLVAPTGSGSGHMPGARLKKPRPCEHGPITVRAGARMAPSRARVWASSRSVPFQHSTNRCRQGFGRERLGNYRRLDVEELPTIGSVS